MINIVNSFSDNIDATLVVATSANHASQWLKDKSILHILNCKKVRESFVKLRKVIVDMKPEVVFSTMLDANIVAAIVTRSLISPPKLIVRETNSHVARGDLNFFQKKGAGWAYKRANKVVALSEGVKRELLSQYDIKPENMKVIHNPVDIESIIASSESVKQSDPPWGKWADGKKIIMGVGRLTKQKGFDLLIRAFAKLDSDEAKLVIVGDGEEKESLKNLAREYGLDKKIMFSGLVDNGIQWLTHCDIFVLSSRWEGFGHVIVEAMAAGTPVVSTNCPYGPVDIIENNVNGLLVEPFDVDALTAGINALINNNDLSTSLSNTARITCKQFDTITITEQYESMILDTASS